MMLLDDGILKICRLENTAQAGNKPLQKLQVVKWQWYGELQVGYNRQYAAKGVDE